MKWRNAICGTMIFAFATFFNAKPLTAESHKGAAYQSDATFMSNAQAQLQLTAEQYPKFEADYNSFNTQLDAIKKKYNNNIVLAQNDTKKLIAETDKSIKTYLSNAQFMAYKKLYNTGQLGKNAKSAIAPGAPKPQITASTTTTTKTQSSQQGTHEVSVKNLGINALVDPLREHLKLTPDQYNKLDADTKAYDAQLVKLGGDATSQSAEIKALNDQTVLKMKTYLNNDQVTKFVIASTMQQNLLTGKNLTNEQKAIVNKMRYDYKMNDAQISMVTLIWAEAKVKLDIIQANASKDPAAAVQLTKNVLNTADAKIKNVLTTQQYNEIHDDIIAQIQK